MTEAAEVDTRGATIALLARKAVWLAPFAAAVAYPFLLKGFSLAVTRPISGLDLGMAAILLVAAVATPLSGLAWATRLGQGGAFTAFERCARRLACFAVAAPPLFVFTGVAGGLIGSPLADELTWVGFWAILLVLTFMGSSEARPATFPPSMRVWRVAHGISATLILLFVGFHLANHLTGWLGETTHRAMMETGRTLYRMPAVEAGLVGLLLFQAVSGMRLAWVRSADRQDGYGAVQLLSGVYLFAFIFTHLTSALVSARWIRGIETDWAWATGAPDGLLLDDWNIRLLPHYLLGSFFVLAHLASGLRQVLLAHGVSGGQANRIWFAGLFCSALVAAFIVLALVGGRI